jgi:hypothetical protein
LIHSIQTSVPGILLDEIMAPGFWDLDIGKPPPLH